MHYDIVVCNRLQGLIKILETLLHYKIDLQEFAKFYFYSYVQHSMAKQI